MTVVSNALLALIRPAKGLDRLGAAIRWIWVPFAVVLVATVLLKTLVTAPIMIAYENEQMDAFIQSDLEKMPEEERARVQQELQAAEDLNTDGIVMTASVVFGVLGALAAILFTALFFFVAAKTSANPVAFGSVLSLASLSFLPHAFRNIVQTIYMSATGVWQQHAGLSSLAAPKEVGAAPGLAYGLLSQVDIWVFWGVALLFGGLLSKALGFDKKRAVTTTLAFVAVALILQTIPVLFDTFVAGAM